MKHLAISALITLALTSATYSSYSQTLDCPTATGAYLLQEGKWASVDPSHSIGFKTTNVAGAAFSCGAAKAHLKAQFRDGKSPYRLSDSVFKMCLVGLIDTGRDITLAKFQQEKDRRELAMASYRMWTGINAQIDPKSVFPINVEKRADKAYLISSKEPLPSGEFILFTIVPDVQALVKANTPGSLGGYDFGSYSR